MSWNNGKETKIFEAWLEEQIAYWRKNGMCEECIDIMVEYEKEKFHKKRNFSENIEVTSLYTTDENGEEYTIKDEALMYEDNVCDDPFEYGFNDPRLNEIWQSLVDEVDKRIFTLLSEGKKQVEIAKTLGISQPAVVKRIKRFKK